MLLLGGREAISEGGKEGPRDDVREVGILLLPLKLLVLRLAANADLQRAHIRTRTHTHSSINNTTGEGAAAATAPVATATAAAVASGAEAAEYRRHPHFWHFLAFSSISRQPYLSPHVFLFPCILL